MKKILGELVKEKKVLLLGFGREGKSTYNMLRKVGGYRELAIADMNEILPPAEDVRTFCGSGYQSVMDDFDIVFKSPGIALEKESHGCLVTSQTNIFLRRFAGQIIGITGTKGKSTTTTLLHHVLKNSGVKTVMVGNIGIPCFDKAEEIDEKTQIVFELSCHQLEYADISPHIAVVINLFEEHLDHYGTKERYFAAKKNVYRFQHEGDILFCSTQCADSLEGVKGEKVTVATGKGADITYKDGVICAYGEKVTIPLSEIHLLGEHNYFNLAMVYGIASRLGVSAEDFVLAIKSYLPPPHRLEYFGDFGGVSFYDDSISTISETCINAVKSLDRAATVIIGGMDRGIDYGLLEEFIRGNDSLNFILMYDSGKRIAKELKESGFGGENVRYVPDLDKAVELAREITPAGGACVLSPAAASYGVFRNFEERGERFKELVRGEQNKSRQA